VEDRKQRTHPAFSLREGEGSAEIILSEPFRVSLGRQDRGWREKREDGIAAFLVVLIV
jgi:hypothetical protein